MADREKLIELLNEASEILLETVGSFNDNHGNGMRADHLIANGVTVQKNGRWIIGDGVDDFDIKCPVCGWSDVFNVAGIAMVKSIAAEMHYCPNCGAKMDGERRTDD